MKQYKKRRESFSTNIYPELADRVKEYAYNNRIKICDIVELALEQYLEGLGDRVKQ